MGQQVNFETTCDPVDLKNCSQYYVDPCDCTKYYQCHQNNKLYHKNCSTGTIYNERIWNCDHPNDDICQTLRPWTRCSVEGMYLHNQSRQEQLRSICFKSSTPNSNNSGDSDQNTNGISVQIITQTIVPTVSGVLVLAMLIGLLILRYRNRRFTRNHEIHLSDPYNSLNSVSSSTPEYYPYPVQRFNPVFDLDLGSSGSSSYITVDEFDSTPSPSTMPGASDHDREYITRGLHHHMYTYTYDNRQIIEIVSNKDSFNSIAGRLDTNSDPLSMPQPCESDRQVPNLNSQEHEINSSGGIPHESIRGSCTTAMSPPTDVDQDFANKPVCSEDSADRSVPNLNSQEQEIASSGGSSYESVRGYDTTAMSQPSDADLTFANTSVFSKDSVDRSVPNMNSHERREASTGDSSYESIRGSVTTAIPQTNDADLTFENETISSEDSAFVFVKKLEPLFHPYISGNGPFPHKVIFSTKDHFLPPCTTFETT
ncbi:hypothetical protein ACJMK2_016138 [Sinanodonta woodiana]|uniref:Chitin-binding type-2 domain-containing protein n=1 Tax=Sinanodonta woodiana TaxID=1069815 RepID=A0ABD3USP0_SINWO